MDTEGTQEARAKVPPTMSPVTFSNFIETHRRTLPSRIDRSLMKSNSGTDQPRILSGLQFMDLTDTAGKPTAKFERMRDTEGEDFKGVWAEVLQAAYPSLFHGFDLTKATQGQIEERFREEYKISGDTVRKAVAFFLALARNAGIPLSPYVKATRTRGVVPRSGGPRRPRTPRERDRERIQRDENEGVGDDRQPSRLHPAVQAWIDEMPANGERWDLSDFEDWLSIFRSSILRAYKIGAS